MNEQALSYQLAETYEVAYPPGPFERAICHTTKLIPADATPEFPIPNGVPPGAIPSGMFMEVAQIGPDDESMATAAPPAGIPPYTAVDICVVPSVTK